jgi:hypothetical protein
MMLLWACAGVPLGVYNIVENFNVALRIQPQILTLLSLFTWMQCKYYGNKWPVSRTLAVAVPVGAMMGGIECGLVFALRQAKRDSVHWPITFMAVLAAVLLSAGVLRHYWDIYKERTVRGISFIFVFIDALGDLTSLISVFFEPTLDILGMVIYGSELVLWCGVMACGGYYNLLPWIQRRLEKGRSQQAAAATSRQASIYSNGSGISRSSSTVFRTASGSGALGGEEHAVRLRHVATGSVNSFHT